MYNVLESKINVWYFYFPCKNEQNIFSSIAW